MHHKQAPLALLLPLPALFQALNILADAILCINAEKIIFHINTSAQKLFGSQAQELLNQPVTSILPAEYNVIHSRFLHSWENGNALDWHCRVFRLKLLTCHGIKIPVTLSVSPVMSETGLIFIVAVRRRLSMYDVANYRDEFKEAIGASISSICHEIRNPLVSIGGFARRIGKDAQLNPKSRHMLDIIQEEVQRLERLASGLSDLSRSMAYQFEYTDINALVSRVCEIMAVPAKAENKQIIFVGLECAPKLLLDHDRIIQVVINLLRNALQASDAGSQIRVSIHPGDDFVQLEISDQGTGIEPENLSKLFEPFFTTKKGGVGLGLPVSRRVIEDHGGVMEIDSVLGQGTNIHINLPV
jgi:PAS domain S-box-containing protein